MDTRVPLCNIITMCIARHHFNLRYRMAHCDASVISTYCCCGICPPYLQWHSPITGRCCSLFPIPLTPFGCWWLIDRQVLAAAFLLEEVDTDAYRDAGKVGCLHREWVH